MKNISTLFLLLLTCIGAAIAQDKKALVNFPSPNAAALGTFGNIPVNPFTGTPNVEIPIYNLEENGVTVPIRLRYHPASVKLNAHPGSVGLGWNLDGYGAITRVVNGNYLDEGKKSNGTTYGFYYHYNKLNVSNWSDAAAINQYGEDLSDPLSTYEVTADVFYFNCMGYSGKFYLDHTGKWVVQSERPVKVVFEPTNGGFVAKPQLREPLASKMPASPANLSANFFNKFTLVTEDGTQMVFGGTNAAGVTDATEFSTSYRNPFNASVVSTTWYIKSIISPNKKTINFTYEPGRMICSLANGYQYTKFNKPDSDWSVLSNDGCSGTGYKGRSPAQGNLIFPVYLRQISTDNKTIVFNRSVSTELRYSPFDLNYNPDKDGPYSFYVYFFTPNDLQWEKYDAVEIRSASNVLLKTFRFGYTSSDQERLKLLSVREEGPAGETGMVTKLFYNPNKMPVYCNNQADHWGFFNNCSLDLFNNSGVTIGQFINQYPATRTPDATGVSYKREILEKIQHPTLGYTTLEYEPHTYSQTVDRSRTAFTASTSNTVAGGLRIKSIRTYQPGHTLAAAKDYYYVKLNASQDNFTTGTSSGILNGEWQYYWPGFQGKDLAGTLFTYDLFSSSSLLPSPFDDESHVGYSEVIEKTNGNGWTQYTYTNYGTDIHGNPHWDEPAIAYIDAERSLYSPFTSKALERGKLTSQVVYKEDKTRVKEVTNRYTPASADFVRGIFTERLNVCSGTTATAQAWFGTSFKYYVYNYNLTRTDEIFYNQPSAAASVSTTTQYGYNPYNLVNKVTTTSSKGETLVKKIKYPSDYSTTAATFIPDLMNRFMVGRPIEEQVWKTNDGVSKLVGGSLTEYARFGSASDIILPFRLYSLETTNSLTETQFGQTLASTAPYAAINPNAAYYKENTTLGYTVIGTPNQVIRRGGVNTAYLWGYNLLLPVAEIKNALSTQCAYTSFETNTDQGRFAYTNANAAFYSTDAKTGNRSFYLYSGGASHDLVRNLAAGKYIVSYWAKGTGSVTVTGQTAVLVGATWAYREVPVNLTVDQDLKLIGSGTSVLIDEVRVIPQGAQITTFTYNPLTGITSATDPNGLTTYYEYDSLGRLKLTRIDNGVDEKGTIVKKLFYRYGK